jgi:hypothetical protein
MGDTKIRSMTRQLFDAAQLTNDGVYLTKSIRSETDPSLVVALKLDAALVGVRLGLFRNAHELRR